MGKFLRPGRWSKYLVTQVGFTLARHDALRLLVALGHSKSLSCHLGWPAQCLPFNVFWFHLFLLYHMIYEGVSPKKSRGATRGQAATGPRSLGLGPLLYRLPMS